MQDLGPADSKVVPRQTRSQSHALWPTNFVAESVYLLSLPSAHNTHKLPHTPVYRNRIAQPKLRLSV